MKVFVSWSGTRSKAVAEMLAEWIKCVLQASQPWISTRDIDKGAIWFSEISDQLKDTTAGIVCLTQDNKEKPWILFETGALAKGISKNRVCTFLVDLKPSDVEDPLAQFNHTSPDSSSMWGLVCSLNAGLEESSRLNEKILRQVFETYWPQFETQFKKILKDVPAASIAAPRTEGSILDEILSNTRALATRVRDIEQSMSNSPSVTQEALNSQSYLQSLAMDQAVPIQIVRSEGQRLGVDPEIVKQMLDKYRMIRPAKRPLFESKVRGDN
ncbi:toll/interleukin-1 receptor domain-containing protein [Pseudomonas cerasi]|uniref:toll/interleukin-1 receptor domain-containing protein n=1 Tax=Pseudomonas cerasi TaxID=1583341 RepID=UPI0023016870|nr:toll/interleukin-1 receptor domain-containing protein [Pseudomonas cerasi]MDA7013578.1 toll/interleukin-1 receptor domain-containing protein [Pseudomonas cerasi]